MKIDLSIFQIYTASFTDFSLDDDDDTKSGLVATFVALSQRSLLHLEIDLETAYSQQNVDESIQETKIESTFQRAISVG